MNLLDGLNKEQKEAVEHGEGPLLIVAGAGTGKTTVLTKRIAYLISKGIKPNEILALTFTEKAAAEMEERVEKLLDYGYYDFWISTFHSFCDRVLKSYGLEIGLPTNYKLVDNTAAWILIKRNFDKFSFLKEYRPLGNPTKFIHALIDHFHVCKNEGIYPEDYLEYADSLKKDLIINDDLEYLQVNEVAEAYHTYQKLLLDNNYLDFGDLINYTIKLFQKRPKVLNKFREQFKYVMIDEFQDTNFVEYELIKKIAHPKNNLTVVGDDDQNVFSFCGASFNNVLRFKNDYPESKDIVLTENYRSPQDVLDLAYNFIQLNNPNRLEYELNKEKEISKDAEEKGVDISNFKKFSKKLKSNSGKEGHLELLSFETVEDEVLGIIDKIWEIKEIDKDVKFSDFCILVRTNDSANYFLRGFERASIPCFFISSKGLYSHPVIIDIIAYFKVVLDFYDSPSLYRVLRSLPFDFTPEEVAKIGWFSEEKSIPLFDALKRPDLLNQFDEEARLKIENLIHSLKEHFNLSKEKNTSEIFIRMINDLHYAKFLKDHTEENLKNWEIIYQFFQKTKSFESTSCDAKLIAFMDQIQMELDSGEEGDLNNQIDDSDSVKIMTIHSAKGLEFKYVFVVNLVHRKFPTDKRKAQIELPKDLIKEVLPEGDFHIEEERRLFYVALTRAKKGLFLTWANDYGGKQLKKPSRFLIESGLINEEEAKKQKTLKKSFNFSKAFNGFKKESIETLNLSHDNLLPSHFSFSQLAAFEKCPLQYKYGHILKIPTKGKPSFSFGKTIHNTLHRFVNLNARMMQSLQIDLFQEIEVERKKINLGLEDLMKIYTEEWIDAWFDTENHKEEYRKKGKEILNNFYKDFLSKDFNVLFLENEPALEKTFGLKLNGYKFVGAIDRIDKNEDGIELIDYKTGTSKKTLSTDDKFQLQIYNLAANKVFNLKPKKMTYYYMEEGIYSSFEPKEKDIEKTEEKVLNIIEKIKRSKFKPTAGWHCEYCDYKNICPHRKF
ncbi:MAG: UvrD-helicase domain-containing protein [Candidatus Pacebacteria bacterium]|nr:UvrD-helicase domain-containing protein [Candidatus Paceibacterota bacterium]